MHYRLITIANELGISEALLKPKNLCVYQEATDLEVVTTDDYRRSICLHQGLLTLGDIYPKYRRLLDGVVLTLVSAFRSIDRQVEIIQRKLNADISRRHSDGFSATGFQRTPYRLRRRYFNARNSARSTGI